MHASVVHTFEVVASSWGSGSDVNAPSVSRVMSEIKLAKKR